MNSPVTFSHLSFSWPDGAIVVEDVCAVFNSGRTGLVGDNGSGKTTLLRLILKELSPTSGEVSVSGHIACLPQNTTMERGETIAGLLGIREKLDALRAIELGSTDERDFEVLGEDWEIETRADAALRGLETAGGPLSRDDLDRSVTQLSGGEAMAVAIAGCRLRRAEITLLDEPTNNLDQVLRESVLEMVRTWPGTLIVVSHDIGLLESMDSIAEVHAGSMNVFGGAYSQWREAREAEQAAASQAEKAAEAQVRTAKKQWVATMDRTTRNLSRGKQKAIGDGMGKAMRDKMKGTAEAGAGRARGMADERVASAKQALAQASDRVRVQEHIRLDLPDPGVHASKKILELTWGEEDFVMEGPERVALTGRNGTGKTTLIEQMLDRKGLLPHVELTPAPHPATPPCPPAGPASHPAVPPCHPAVGRISGGSEQEGIPQTRIHGQLLTHRVAYLPQRLTILDDRLDAISSVLQACPQATQSTVRSQLARMLIRGDDAFRPVGTLSGGERFRVAMARLLFADPPAQLLILDEPTNNLDQASVVHLVEALSAYHGAILVVSHDPQFLSRVGVTTRLELSAGAITVHHGWDDDPQTR